MLLAALSAALALLLLTAANLSLFFLLRAGRRSHEFAIRAALGASRRQLIVAALGEIGGLAAPGCAGGLLLCWWLLAELRLRLPAGLPRGYELGLDGHVALAAISCGVLIGVISAIGPVVIAGRAAHTNIGHAGAAGDPDPRTPLAGRLLAGAQVALAIALVGICLAMIRTVHSLGSRDLGFDAAHLVSVEFMLQDAAQPKQFLTRVRAELLTVPGVAAAAIATHPPAIGDRYGAMIQLPGRPPLGSIEFELVGPGYFEALGVPVIAGRSITDADTSEAPMVAVVNEVFAHAYLGGAAAVGGKLKFELPPHKWRVIVGVVGAFRDMAAGRPAAPEVFIPAAQSAGYMDTVVVRSSGPPDRLTALIGPRL
ncbi:MAG: ABC transporter permease, partial [Terriglobales bacterium]